MITLLSRLSPIYLVIYQLDEGELGATIQIGNNYKIQYISAR